MRTIDGSEGGGQLLRSALSLAALSGEPIRLESIRGDRPDPGLKPQHMAAVEAVAQLCHATVEGVDRGAESLTFEPGELSGGDITVEIPTAGSVSLLFDAVLPLTTALPGSATVTATGGTEVKWAPPLAAHERVKLPLLRRFGLHAALERDRTGFYPAGGGRARLSLAPSTLSALTLTERGPLSHATIHSRSSADLADADVAARQAQSACTVLEAAGIPVREESVIRATTDSTGSAILVGLQYEGARAGFDALGERGTSAETVGETAAELALGFHGGSAAVDRHLADQLLIFLALAGGEMRIPELTAHVESSLELLATFGFDLTAEKSGETYVVRGE